jgi:predicted phage gp36 major capsid-like protein
MNTRKSKSAPRNQAVKKSNLQLNSRGENRGHESEEDLSEAAEEIYRNLFDKTNSEVKSVQTEILNRRDQQENGLGQTYKQQTEVIMNTRQNWIPSLTKSLLHLKKRKENLTKTLSYLDNHLSLLKSPSNVLQNDLEEIRKLEVDKLRQEVR